MVEVPDKKALVMASANPAYTLDTAMCFIV